MTLKYLKWGAFLMASVVLALSFVYVKSLEEENARFQRLERQIEALRQTDAHLNQDLLKVRISFLDFYDPLVANVQRINALLAGLKEPDYAALEKADGARQLQALSQLMVRKEHLIEEYKSQNAILKNSTSYFPRAARELVEQGGRRHPWLGEAGNALVRDMLTYDQVNDPELKVRILDLLSRMRARRARYPADAQAEMDRVLLHAETILKYRESVDTLLARLMAMPTEQSLQTLGRICERHYWHMQRNANVYRLYLYLSLFALLLMAYTGYVLFRLRASSHALRQEKELAQVTLQSIADGVITTDAEGRLESMNATAERLTGWTRAEAHGQSLAHVLHIVNEDYQPMEIHGGVQAGHADDALLIQRNGSMHAVETVSSPIHGGHGEQVGSVLILHDVSERRQARLKLMEREARLQAVMDHVADGIITVNEGGRVESVNPTAARIFGYVPEEVIGQELKRLMPEQFHAAHDAGFNRYLQGRDGKLIGKGSVEVQGKRKDGSLFPMELEVSAMRWQGQHLFIGILRDITERKAAEAKLSFLANYDALTGLPNRALFRDRLHHAMVQAARREKLLALFFLDLDRFKVINDTLGHLLGDKLLQRVAERVQSCVRESDTVARFGGDEFTVILEGVSNVEEAADCAGSILNSFGQPLSLDGHEVFVTASIGITIFPFDDEDLDNLVKNADTAMYRAKATGRNSYQFYTADMNARALERLHLENSLRRALEREEFRLHYQPKIDLRSGEMVGMEALLRWEHPELGLVSPLEFIPLLEETGLIIPVGEWVLREACAQNKAWQDEGRKALRMAVNLSVSQFQYGGLVQGLAAILAETALSAEFLEVEITESMVAQHPQEAAQILRQIKAMGVRIAIDDFGTGYSSLSYLKDFPIDCLKIDRSFVQDIPADADNTAITLAIIAMARSLRLQVVAEGVERGEQAEFLRLHACDQAQGFYYGRPMPASVFAGLLPVRRTASA